MAITAYSVVGIRFLGNEEKKTDSKDTGLRKRGALVGWIAVGGLTLSICAVWYFVPGLGRYIDLHPAFYPAAFAGMSLLMLSLACVLGLESSYLRRSWLRRAAGQAELKGLEPLSPLQSIFSRLPDPLEWIWQPLWRTSVGMRMKEAWLSSDLPGSISLYPSLIVFLAMLGYLIGARIAGPLLGVAVALTAGSSVVRLVRGRVNRASREVEEQLPAALDSLAAGIASGQSIQLALHAVASEQSGSLGILLREISTRIQLGIPVDEALQRVLEEHAHEGLSLAIEGIILQRKFGGDQVRMLDDMAALLRGRLELEREVRAITAQGRLSGAIVAGLVPVSAGFLLMFNPGYLDILFDTLVGQILIVLTFSLQIAGWYVISRLVRVRY